MVKYLMKGCITPAAEDSILKLRVVRCPLSLQLRAAKAFATYLVKCSSMAVQPQKLPPSFD